MKPGLARKIAEITTVPLFLLSALGTNVVHAERAEEKDLDDVGWYEFLTTDIAKLSAPGADNVYYNIINPQGGGNDVRIRYRLRLENLLEDELKGYSLYEGLGLLNYKNVTFYYNKPKSSKKHVGWVYYGYYHFPLWETRTLSREELNKKLIVFMLRGVRDQDIAEPVIFYKETRDGMEYKVLEFEYTEKRKVYKGWFYYRHNPDYSLVHYFRKVYETKSKYAETANTIFDQIIDAAILTEEAEEEGYLKCVLRSARNLISSVEYERKEEEEKDTKKKEKDKEKEAIRVKYRDTGIEETLDVRDEKLKDFAGKRKLMLAELDKLAAKYPSEPKIYYAQAMLNEYNDAGERYGDSFDKAQVLEYYKKSIEADSKFFYAHYNTAIIYERKNQNAEAIEYLKKCVNICPVDILSLYMLGRLYEQNGDYENAYFHYWNAGNTCTYQEKSYCYKLPRKIKKKCKYLINKKKVKKLKEEKSDVVSRSTMALYFYVNPELLVRMFESDYTQMGDNVFSCFDGYILWHGYLGGIKNKADVTAKWYSPDNTVFKEDNKVNSVKGDMSSYYFYLNIAGTDAEKIPGVWKIEVYFKDSLIDTKYFYLFDC